MEESNNEFYLSDCNLTKNGVILRIKNSVKNVDIHTLATTALVFHSTLLCSVGNLPSPCDYKTDLKTCFKMYHTGK